ncbi:diguanylate cyclase (GGDEF)-like protein/PAS domain S-box-containing protein [Pseudomonas nitritireducens]|uniref:Diguanylate cyclase (GGDEF)-like protein/PAS domain S-box-containing protein n=1 Tax=Pseudomonas nitroreducens TaxID=46680 RepID=A0A7W7NZU7_PSENT|nr:sensor domain-containing diguanylate cyclase [Pseudomonas nitritireducens]MBB4862866.1 diguanylate cyclase (GGDEF)-like protein/PAS domain S-box-containing protein [Pseudomonas nitritireducens]
MDENKLPADQEEALLALLHSRAEVTRLKEREQLFSALLASVNSVLWAFDWQAQRMVYVSPAYERIFGRSAALLLADYNEWRNCIYPDDLDYAQSTLQEVLERGAIEQREYRILRADGEVRWLSDKCFVSQHSEAGLPLMIVGIAEDITDKKHLETELHRLATTDVLTQSSNRRYFFDSAEQAFRDCKATSTPLAFLLLDVDDFKKINDVYGHQVGDVVLQRIAQCGAGALRRGDLFGRIGGEEFAVLLPGCDENMARQIGERLQREVQRLRFNEAEHFFSVTISQGMTMLLPDDQNLSALYSRSDAALYQAKRTGKDRLVQG